MTLQGPLASRVSICCFQKKEINTLKISIRTYLHREWESAGDAQSIEGFFVVVFFNGLYTRMN